MRNLDGGEVTSAVLWGVCIGAAVWVGAHVVALVRAGEGPALLAELRALPRAAWGRAVALVRGRS